MHGLGGSEKSFGSMRKFLEHRDPCYLPYMFKYKTGDFKMNAVQFSEDLDSFIKFKTDSDLRPKDKISLIMHSQGGLVGSFWLKRILDQKSIFLNHVDSFITLSTPYWGSSSASFGSHFFYTLPEEVENPISPFGKEELHSMKYGSGNINQLEKNYSHVFKSIPNLRPLAIGGLKQGYNPWYGEDDTAVSVYSSRPDHYTLDDEIELSEKPKTIAEKDFALSDFVPFVAVKAGHFKLDLPGVANIPEVCLSTPSCDHPSVTYVLDQLEGKTLRNHGLEGFRKYRVHFYLENVVEQNLNMKDFSVNIIKSDRDSESEDFEAGQGSSVSFSFSGRNTSLSTETCAIKLFYKNKLLRNYQVPVRGGYSSFVRVKVKNELLANE